MIINATARSYDPWKTPLLPPPQGVTPNFLNAESRAAHAHVTVGVCSTLIVFFVALRVHRRLRLSRGWGLDDYYLVAATLLTLGYGGLIIARTRPYGPRAWNIPRAKITIQLAEKNLAGMLTHVASTLFLKLSLFALYARLFGVSRSTRRAAHAGSAAVALFYSGFAATLLALCVPLRAERGLAANAKQRCEATDDARLAALLTFNIASDALVFALPVRVVWRLQQLPVRRKCALSALFLMGLLACVCSVFRILVAMTSLGHEDIIWRLIQLLCLGYAEVTIGLICACLPVVWPDLRYITDLATRLIGRLLEYIGRRYGHRNTSCSGSHDSCPSCTKLPSPVSPPVAAYSAYAPADSTISRTATVVTSAAATDSPHAGSQNATTTTPASVQTLDSLPSYHNHLHPRPSAWPSKKHHQHQLQQKKQQQQPSRRSDGLQKRHQLRGPPPPPLPPPPPQPSTLQRGWKPRTLTHLTPPLPPRPAIIRGPLPRFTHRGMCACCGGGGSGGVGDGDRSRRCVHLSRLAQATWRRGSDNDTLDEYYQERLEADAATAVHD